MNCPNCQIENVSGAKYCNACGTELETSCQQCGKINPPGSNFCNKCGHSLSKAVSTNPSTAAFEHGKPNILPMDSFAPDDGERRQATILFSDLSGYTSMNEKLDPEEVGMITSHIKSEAERIVEGYEGTVNQFVGDEVLALFGIPKAHEFTTLFSCFEKMLSINGQFVSVMGDAGLGKSRLIYEFRHALNRSEINVLRGRCQSYGMSIP